MGDNKRIRKKYDTPMHPWNKDRIDAEKRYKKEFGLVNKKELWKAGTVLKKFKDQIKKFPSMPVDRAKLQAEKLRKRLMKYGLIEESTDLGEVLGYDTEVILARRLQTIVFKKGYAKSIKQARQFITHEHITVAGKTVNAPSYLVTIDEEAQVQFHPSSQLTNEMHPERAPKEQKTKEQKKGVPQGEKPEVVKLKEGDAE